MSIELPKTLKTTEVKLPQEMQDLITNLQQQNQPKIPNEILFSLESKLPITLAVDYLKYKFVK